MTEDSLILAAELKMTDEAQSSSSPWATQFLLLLFFAPIIGIPIIIGAVLKSEAPRVDATPSQEWAFFLTIIAVAFYTVRSSFKSKESQWLGLSYYGSAEWTDSLRIKGEPIDFGELKPIEEGKEPVRAFKYGRPVDLPKAKPGSHLWGIRFERKAIPEIDVALPEHFEKCCKFVGHVGFGYVGWMPWTVKHISFASFLRTSWTQDPDGTIVPIGVLTDYDLLREQLKGGLEPKAPTREEMKVAANIRDHYYRDEVVKELEIERAKTNNLKAQLKNKDTELEERLGAVLDQWDKSGKKNKPAMGFAPSRRRKLLYFGIIIGLMALGAFLLVRK